MRFYQIRDYYIEDSRPGARQFFDAQRNRFAAVRYCSTIAHARFFVDAYGANDGPQSRAADILVVEVEIATDKDAILTLLNGGELFGMARRCERGSVYEIGPRGGLRESKEYDV